MPALHLVDSFELAMHGDLPNPVKTIRFLSDKGEEIKVEFEKCDIIFGNIKNDCHFGRKPGGGVSYGPYHLRDVKLVVKGKKATLFIDNKLFGTIIVKPNIVYRTVIIKGIKDYDEIYGLSVRNL